MINLYTNYKSTGKWDKQDTNRNKVLVGFSESLKQEHFKNKESSGNPTRSATKTPATEPGNSTGLPAWKFNNVGNTTMLPDTKAKYKWCKLHGR